MKTIILSILSAFTSLSIFSGSLMDVKNIWASKVIIQENSTHIVENNESVKKENISSNNSEKNNSNNVQNSLTSNKIEVDQKVETNKKEENSSSKVVEENLELENKIIKKKSIKPGLENDKNIILIDKSNGTCAQAIEVFYEDAYYKYYFSCIKSHSMYVYKNGIEYRLVDALNKGIVTIKELEENGYSFPKISKNTVVK